MLQPKLNLKVSQKQILTPGLVQMVSVLALNKLELTDMINAELTENPVLEELDSSVPLLDEVSAREEKMDRDSSASGAGGAGASRRKRKIPSKKSTLAPSSSDYLDPGLRTSIEMEDSEKPSFENFLSKPATLTDHLMWQLGSLHVKEDVHRAAELVIGNLNEDGYLKATRRRVAGPDGRRHGLCRGSGRLPCRKPLRIRSHRRRPVASPLPSIANCRPWPIAGVAIAEAEDDSAAAEVLDPSVADHSAVRPHLVPPRTAPARVPFSRDALLEAIDLVQQLDPVGVGARDLARVPAGAAHEPEDAASQERADGNHVAEQEALEDAIVLVSDHLPACRTRTTRKLRRPSIARWKR